MFQILDYILIGVMLISGLLAMSRGFVREVLSLATLVVAILAAYYAVSNKQIMDMAGPHFDKFAYAQLVVGAVTFLGVLAIVSIITSRLSNWIVDSRVGAIDRSMGFLFGAARGLVLVAVCYGIYNFLLPTDKQEQWVRDAKTLPYISRTADFMKSLIPQRMRDQIGLGDQKETAADPTGKGDAQSVSPAQQQGMGNLAKGASGQ